MRPSIEPLFQGSSSLQAGGGLSVESFPQSRILAWGVVFCLALSVIVVWLHGVAVDQDLVPAQILAGAVHYPAGHPHDVAYRKTFNLFNYLLAGLWAVLPNSVLLSALRNLLFVFLRPPFPSTAHIR